MPEPEPHYPEPPAPKPKPSECAGTIVELAVGTPDLSTLVAAVTAADLVETLSGDGPFTVFGMYNIIPVPCMMSMSYSLVIRDSYQLAFILVYA